MRRGLNRVTIIGYLERAPELRYTPKGRPVTSFSVATPHQWVSSEGTHHEELEWFSVVAWGELAHICHTQLDKGKRVYVEGRLKTRSWEDSQGKRHFRTEIVARDMIVLGSQDESNIEDEYHIEGDMDAFDY